MRCLLQAGGLMGRLQGRQIGTEDYPDLRPTPPKYKRITMNKIPSFTIDHERLLRGIYVSRKNPTANRCYT